MKQTITTSHLTKALFALPFAALLTATPLLHAEEPRRIFDAEKQQYVPNPDYHESAATIAASHIPRPPGEPRRVYNAESERFVANPDYVDHSPVLKVIRTGEPRRVFDSEKQQYVPNPNYHGNGGATYIVVKNGVNQHQVTTTPTVVATHVTTKTVAKASHPVDHKNQHQDSLASR